MRYLSNNQILVYGGMMNLKTPRNFHVSTQAITSGLKPGSEPYLSTDISSNQYYELSLFGKIVF